MRKSNVNSILMHIFLVLMSIFSLFPFYWMVVSSTNSTSQINMGKFTFGDQLLVNFTNLTSQVDSGAGVLEHVKNCVDQYGVNACRVLYRRLCV
nr:hypothetical protein PJ912_18160 [Pectobacterium colocasium]